jgi:hypothetical protein
VGARHCESSWRRFKNRVKNQIFFLVSCAQQHFLCYRTTSSFVQPTIPTYSLTFSLDMSQLQNITNMPATTPKKSAIAFEVALEKNPNARTPKRLEKQLSELKDKRRYLYMAWLF